MTRMSREEQNALVHSLLTGQEDEEIIVWVVAAHVHRNGECDGDLHMAGTTGDVHDTVTMLMTAVQTVLEQDGLEPLPEAPDSPEGL